MSLAIEVVESQLIEQSTLLEICELCTDARTRRISLVPSNRWGRAST